MSGPVLTPERASGQAGSLDALLIDVALGPVRRFAPNIYRQAVGRAGSAAANPVRRLRSLAAESGWIARATSTLAPEHADLETVMARMRALA